MNLEKLVLTLWAVLSLIAVAIAGACVWIDAHPAFQAVLDEYQVNYLTVFVWSAPAPFVLAILLPILGGILALLRWAVHGAAGGAALLVHHGHLHGLR